MTDRRRTFYNFDEICVNCGCTYGSHHGGSSPWPNNYCPGKENCMDWENNLKKTCFEGSGRYRAKCAVCNKVFEITRTEAIEGVDVCPKCADELAYKDHLCGDECDINNCPDEPSHCPFGMEQLRDKAEMRADLAKDKESGL